MCAHVQGEIGGLHEGVTADRADEGLLSSVGADVGGQGGLVLESGKNKINLSKYEFDV